jgi:hypothetical protein
MLEVVVQQVEHLHQAQVLQELLAGLVEVELAETQIKMELQEPSILAVVVAVVGIRDLDFKVEQVVLVS